MNGASLRHVATCKIQSSTGSYWLTRGVLKTVPDTFDTWFWTIDAARFLQMVHRTHVPSLDPTLQILYTVCMSAEVPSFSHWVYVWHTRYLPESWSYMELSFSLVVNGHLWPSTVIVCHSRDMSRLLSEPSSGSRRNKLLQKHLPL